MTPFEEQLRQAMTRRDPPADFARRVLERVQREERRKAERGALGWLRGRREALGSVRAWRLAGATAALLAVSGSVLYQHHERAVRGEAAKQKLLMAVRIAGVKLHQVHRHVLEATEVSQ